MYLDEFDSRSSRGGDNVVVGENSMLCNDTFDSSNLIRTNEDIPSSPNAEAVAYLNTRVEFFACYDVGELIHFVLLS